MAKKPRSGRPAGDNFQLWLGLDIIGNWITSGKIKDNGNDLWLEQEVGEKKAGIFDDILSFEKEKHSFYQVKHTIQIKGDLIQLDDLIDKDSNISLVKMIASFRKIKENYKNFPFELIVYSNKSAGKDLRKLLDSNGQFILTIRELKPLARGSTKDFISKLLKITKDKKLLKAFLKSLHFKLGENKLDGLMGKVMNLINNPDLILSLKRLMMKSKSEKLRIDRYKVNYYWKEASRLNSQIPLLKGLNKIQEQLQKQENLLIDIQKPNISEKAKIISIVELLSIVLPEKLPGIELGYPLKSLDKIIKSKEIQLLKKHLEELRSDINHLDFSKDWLLQRVWFFAGNFWYFIRNFQRSCDYYSTLLKYEILIDPEEGEAYDFFALNFNFSYALYQLNHVEKALQIIEDAIRLDSSSALAWSNKATFLESFKDYQGSLEASNKAIELDPSIAEAWNSKGVALLNFGKFKDAESAIDQAIILEPFLSEPLYNKALVLSRLENYEEALIFYNLALLINPMFFEALYDKGLTLLNMENFEESLESTNLALSLKPNSKEPYLNKALVLTELGKFEQALFTINQVLRIDSNFVRGLGIKSSILFEMGKKVEALELIQKACELYPKDYRVWYKQGLLLLKSNKTEEGLKALDKAFLLEPSDKQVLLEYGKALEKRNDYEKAIDIYEKALMNFPNLELALLGKLVGLYELGRLKDAFDFLQEIPTEFLRRDNFLVLKSVILEKLDRLEEALESINQATELDSTNSHAWYCRGVILARFEDHQSAYESFQKSVNLNPTYIEALFNLGMSASKLDLYDQSIPAYRKVIDLDPLNWKAMINLSALLLKKNEPDEALELVDEILKNKPTDLNARINKGIALSKLERFQEAILMFNEVLRDSPEDFSALYNKAMTLIDTLRYSESLEILDKLIQIDPKTPSLVMWFFVAILETWIQEKDETRQQELLKRSQSLVNPTDPITIGVFWQTLCKVLKQIENESLLNLLINQCYSVIYSNNKEIVLGALRSDLIIEEIQLDAEMIKIHSLLLDRFTKNEDLKE